MDDDGTALRSARFVTAGYENALHRMYLYGQGLATEQLAQPFVGLALADAESAVWHHPVRVLADTLKTACWQAGLTPREFVVPVVASAGRASDLDVIESRELVADSTELVVRGHWYDGALGVAAAGEAMFGLAMALVRLRLPGWIAVPADAAASEDVDAVAILEDLGLVRVVSGTDSLAALADGLSGLVGGDTADGRLADALAGRATLRVPPVGSPAMRELAALLWEAGHATLTPVLRAAAVRHDVVRLIARGAAGPGHVAVIAGPADHATGSYVVDGSGRNSIRLRPNDPAGDGEGRQDRRATRALTAVTDAELQAGAVVGVEHIASVAECEPELLAGVLDCRVLGAVTHPGDVDGALRYHRL